MELDLFLAQLSPVLGALIALLHLAGLVAAVTALLNARTPQGAIAWSLFLVMFPLLALPAFFVFGERKFVGYVLARREGRQPLQALAQAVADRHLPTLKAEFAAGERDLTVFENLAAMPFTCGNRARLLIDGEATFEAIFAGIDQAREYLLVQFYIVHDDGLGRALQQRLIDPSQSAPLPAQLPQPPQDRGGRRPARLGGWPQRGRRISGQGSETESVAGHPRGSAWPGGAGGATGLSRGLEIHDR